MQRTFLLSVIFLLLLIGCSPNRGLPDQPGEYPIKDRSVVFDGERYEFWWADGAGELHRAEARDIKLVQDERNYLEIRGNKEAILHLRSDEPIAVQSEDSAGRYAANWFPFPVPIGGPVVIGRSEPPPSQPSYRYPPSDVARRGETLEGSISRDRPAPPDYRRTQPAPYSISGQASGTGGGTAATDKARSSISGQAGGTGAGTAATGKGSVTGSGAGGARSSGSFLGGKSSGSLTGGASKGIGGGRSFSFGGRRR